MSSKEALAWRARSVASALILVSCASLVIGQQRQPAGRGVAVPPAGGRTRSENSVGTASRRVPVPNQAQLKVMAVVNRESISRTDLANQCIRRFGKDVLDSLINKHLIAQACQQRGVVVTQQEMRQELEKIAEKFKLPVDRWLQLLRDERNISAEQYMQEIIWPTLALRKLAANELAVSQGELDQAFETEYGARVKVRVIVCSSEKKAQDLHKMAMAKPDEFGTLAKNNSEDPNSAAARGLIPAIRKYSGDKQVEQVAFSMKEGQISNILKVASQFIIMKCEKHVPPTYVPEKFKADAMNRLRDRIVDKKMRTAAGRIFGDLKKQAKVINAYENAELQKQQPGVAALLNGQPISVQQLGEECIKRHGVDVLDGEINRKVLLQELTRRKLTIAQQHIDQEIARAAQSFGFIRKDGSADVQKWLQNVTKEGATVDLYVDDVVWPTVALKRLTEGRVVVSNEDMQKGFEANYGPRVEVMAIVLSNQRQAQQVWEMARNNPTNAFFGQLAEQYSIEPVSRSNRGKVPPVRRHGGRPAVEQEAFRLKPGELSKIVAIGNKYIIMRCLGQTKPVVQEFSAVKDELYKDIFEKKSRAEMAKEYDRLRQSADIENYFAGVRQQPAQPSATPAAARRSLKTAR